MKRFIFSLSHIIILITLFGINYPLETNAKPVLKPRLVVMTDIGDCDVEPDDMESAIRLMAYADQFEIEAIMTTVGWNCDPYPEEWSKYLDMVVDAYGKDIKNLMKRSGQKTFKCYEAENRKQEIGYWPSIDYIRSRCMPGSNKAGIRVIGKDNDSKGSDFLIQLADEKDTRPIWVATWGSGNTLAQAIWKIKNTRTPEQLKEFLHKFRVFTITDQDMVYAMRMNRAYSSHQWMRKEFQDDLIFIWDEGTWQLQCELGKQNWDKHKNFIQNHGALGKIYPNYKWGVEGDTPSFLHIMPYGLNDPEEPTQAGWAGCHKYGICPDTLTYAWTSWQQPQLSITENYKKRFYADELNDFCARMQWAKEGTGNTNPIVYVNGKCSNKPIVIKSKADTTITLDASKTKDMENDSLSFCWWQQPESSSYEKMINIENKNSSIANIQIPKDSKGKSIHIICEVHDNGNFNLVSYSRIIIKVNE